MAMTRVEQFSAHRAPNGLRRIVDRPKMNVGSLVEGQHNGCVSPAERVVNVVRFEKIVDLAAVDMGPGVVELPHEVASAAPSIGRIGGVAASALPPTA